MDNQLTILIVDDEPNNLRLLQQILKNTYELKFAKDGVSALAAAEKHKPDLILLDIMMPGMSGHEVCRRLKSNPLTKNMPVMFVTAMNKEEDESKGFELGAVDYITKPVKSAVVLARVNTHLALKTAQSKIQKQNRELQNQADALNKSLAENKEARARLDGILASVADGLIVTDIHDKVVLMNKAAEKLLDINLSDAVGTSIDSAIKDKTLSDNIHNLLNSKQAAKQFDFEMPSSDSKHSKIMRARTSIIYDSQGINTGIVTIIHDVTHEREVDRMKTEFISTAAHELRTPLTSIQGFSEIMITRDNLKKEDRDRFLGYINKQAVGLGKIINDLLDISRIESGKGISLEPEQCVLGDIIKSVVPYFQENSPAHSFELNTSEERAELFLDKEKIGQVLKNLLSNAVKYSPEGGLIKIESGPNGNVYKTSITDQGLGMTPEQLEHVFDKFYRVDASNSAIEGTGLGMSIVKHIIEAHKGEVFIESEYGKGTTVGFTIPVK